MNNKIPLLKLNHSMTSDTNFIIVLDCLNPKVDLASPRRIHEDIRSRLIGVDSPENIERNLKLRTCSSIKDLREVFIHLDDIFSVPGFKPSILIHAHGSKDNGLHLPDGTHMGWTELIHNFRSITQKCGGDLTIIAGFCHSYELINKINFESMLPFAFYYGYSGEISSGTVESEMAAIQESFLGDGGKTVSKNIECFSIKLFSEYKFVMQILSPALLMAADPHSLARIRPELSLGTIKKKFNQSWQGPRSGTVKLINKAVRDDLLSKNIAESLMYDTVRRQEVLIAIDSFFAALNNPDG